VKFNAIEAEKAKYPVSLMCRVLEVSRAGYYASRARPESNRTKANRQLAAKIRDVYDTSRRRYGSPRVHAELRVGGDKVGRHRVARMMRQEGLVARKKRRFRATTQSKHGEPVARNVLARNFAVEKLNQAWVGDITYLPTAEGWLYLAVLLDLCSKAVVGWAMSEELDASIALAALRMALERRRPASGLVHHSDRGVQYASESYRRALAANGLVPSMSRKGNCWDNAPAESFFGSLKVELVGDCVFPSRAVARTEVFEYLEVFYNRIRRHSSLGYVSPTEFERRLALDPAAVVGVTPDRTLRAPQGRRGLLKGAPGYKRQRHRQHPAPCNLP
jgi:transposase InsO family protein